MEQIYIGKGNICRGLSKKGDVVYGYYVEIPAPLKSKKNPVGYIFYPNDDRNKKENYMNRIEVLPETIQRFTSVYDINKTPLFEGDKVRLVNETYDVQGEIRIDYGSLYLLRSSTYSMITRADRLMLIERSHK